MIDNEYAAIGAHFGGGFRTGNRASRFPTYTANASLNYLCTSVGTTSPNIILLGSGLAAVGLGRRRRR